MSQTRITLTPQVVPLAEELLHLTGVANLSNLFCLLLTRYGHHLKNSWVIGVNLPPASMQQTASMQTFQYELSPTPEPVMELPQHEDPVIQRIRSLIEDF